MRDAGPKAVCYNCGARYSGWSLAQREICDCGGKLYTNFPYNVITGYIKAGRHMGKYLVFLNCKGEAIGRPIAVSSPEEADGFLENKPAGTAYHFIATKDELLSKDYSLTEEDFEG